MINAKDWLEYAKKFQGHKCPAMVVGLKAGAAALNKLGVKRAKDRELILLVDVGKNHWAVDSVDGLQVITGCTTGKGNLILTDKGKLSFILIDTKQKQAVRVTPRPDVILSFRKTEFFNQFRKRGCPASEIPDELVDPMIEYIMNTTDEELLKISDIFEFEYTEEPRSFNSFVCEECDEIVIEEYGRIKGDKMVCIDCAKRK